LQVQTENLCSVNLDIDNKDAVERGQFPEQNNAMSVSKSKRLSRNATTATTSKEGSGSNHGSLVQATISTLFKKVEEVRSYDFNLVIESACFFPFPFYSFHSGRIKKTLLRCWFFQFLTAPLHF